MDLSSRTSDLSSSIYPIPHSQHYVQQPIKTEEQPVVIDSGPRRRSQLYPSRHLPHPSLTSPGYANHTLLPASGAHHQGYGDRASRPHLSLPSGHPIGASDSSGRQSFHSPCSSCDYDHPPPSAFTQGPLHIAHPSAYSQYIPAPQTRYDLRTSTSQPSTSSLLLPPAGPSHPLRPPLLHLASSGLDFDERAIRSPHPPLTATFHQGNPRLWPAQGPARSAHLGVAPPSAELERPFHSSPIAHESDPRQAHYYRTEAQLPYPSAPPHLPPLTTGITDHLASPVLIPPPLKFSYSNSPPLPLSAPLPIYHETFTMPPRKKAGLGTSSGRPTPANSQTTASSTARSRRTLKGNGWTVEQTYDSTGRQKDVIVIDDSESPGRIPRKRTRAQVAAGQANGHSVTGSTASVAGSTKKRKVEPSESGVAKKPKAKASGTAASNHIHTTALQPKQVVPTAQSSSSSHPPWDDPEGHYIVKPDDVIANKYKIVRLLGQGTFGKVVEARHLETRKKVAIKVIRAVQKYRDASKIEIRVLEALKRNDPNNFNNCIHLVEYFDFRSHPCLVSELYGMSVFDFLKQNSFSPFPDRHIQDFAKSLLKSVDFLHRLRLVHTDLKPENILLANHDSRQNGPRVKGSKARNILRNTDIRLIDFGSATFENEYHSSVVSTRHYRAPEIILGLPWSYPCDLFSIGCILVEFYTGEALFQTHDNLEHLGMMEVVMGKMPMSLIERGRIKKPEFFKGHRVDYPNATVSRQSRKFVKQMRSLPEIIPPNTPHNKLFLDLIVRLLDFEPDSRINIGQALRHPYCSMNIDPPP